METQRLLMKPHDPITGANRSLRLSINEALTESFRKLQNFLVRMLGILLSLHKHLKMKDYVIVLQHMGHFAHKLQRMRNSC